MHWQAQSSWFSKHPTASYACFVADIVWYQLLTWLAVLVKGWRTSSAAPQYQTYSSQPALRLSSHSDRGSVSHSACTVPWDIVGWSLQQHLCSNQPYCLHRSSTGLGTSPLTISQTPECPESTCWLPRHSHLPWLQESQEYSLPPGCWMSCPNIRWQEEGFLY